MNAPPAKPKPPRRPPQLFTGIILCSTCGTEVHRREHVRHTARQRDAFEEQGRLALLKHAMTVTDVRGKEALTAHAVAEGKRYVAHAQPLYVNEHHLHPDVEAGSGEPIPEHMQITRVMKMFGLLGD